MRTTLRAALILATAAAATGIAGTASALVDVKVEVQTHLTALGYNPGGIDGAFGRGSRTALQRFERDQGLPADGQIDDRSRQALIAQVERAQTQRFGRALTGFWGTSRGCQREENRMRIEGYTVSHKPIWSDRTFNYVMLPTTDTSKLTIAWDAAGQSTGQNVEYQRSGTLLRAPELNMLGIGPCTRYGVRDEVAFVPSDQPGNGSRGAGGGSNSSGGFGVDSSLANASSAELLEALQARLSKDSGSATALRRELDELKGANARLERRVQAFADRANQNLRDQQQLRSQNNTLTQQNQDLTGQVQRLTAEVERLGNRRGGSASLRRDLREAQSALDFANQRTQQLQQSIQQLQSANQQLQAANQQLANQLQRRGGNTSSTTTTLSGEDALKIIIPQILNNLGN